MAKIACQKKKACLFIWISKLFCQNICKVIHKLKMGPLFYLFSSLIPIWKGSGEYFASESNLPTQKQNKECFFRMG